MGDDDFLQIRSGLRSIPQTLFTNVDQLMLYVADFERVNLKVACDDRTVDQFVKTFSNVDVR